MSEDKDNQALLGRMSPIFDLELFSSGAQVTDFACHARRLGLLASSGSDYHGPGESYVDLGDMPPLPAGVTPVWHDW